jgi:hypothetical protein
LVWRAALVKPFLQKGAAPFAFDNRGGIDLHCADAASVNGRAMVRPRRLAPIPAGVRGAAGAWPPIGSAAE